MSIAQRLQRAHLAQVTPYQSARRSMAGGNIWLNANEAAATPCDALAAANLNRYPEFQSRDLNQAYADYAQVNIDQVLSSRGSDEAIELLIRAFCEPNRDRIIICPPTYGMYAISAQTHGAEVVEVPLTEAKLDIDSIINSLDRVKLIFICSPSNPLGNGLPLQQLDLLLERVGSRALVVVDEAYIEFAAVAQQQPLNAITQWLSRYPQLVVLRTLSKAFGLAAIRCGFTIANTDVIEVLRKVIAPYPLPKHSVAVATQALAPAAIMQMQTQTQQINLRRARFIHALGKPSWLIKAWPSCTNFVLLSVTDASALVQKCAQQGVLIRNQSTQLGLPNSVRISIGSDSEMQQLLEILL